MEHFAALPSPDDFRSAPRRAVALMGMSGVGKTHIARMLRASGDWFHYSVDYRIGTRYMGEAIVDNFKREAMKSPYLRDLLLSDSIYIASNIAFENLKPLSSYLGKPGAIDRGGIPFDEYLRRQREHRLAEIAATGDIERFLVKAKDIYGYDHFVADTSGSLCEVVAPDDPTDPVLQALSRHALPVYIRESEQDVEQLCRRFDADPKPLYFDEDFLRGLWRDFLSETGGESETVDPDAFMRWSYRRQIQHRRPRYQRIAERWGVAIDKAALEKVRDEADFIDLITNALARTADTAR